MTRIRIFLFIFSLLTTPFTFLTAQDLEGHADLLVGGNRLLDGAQAIGEPAIAHVSDRSEYQVFYSRQIAPNSPDHRIHVKSVRSDGSALPNHPARPLIARSTRRLEETHPAAYGGRIQSQTGYTLVAYIENERTIKGFFWDPLGRSKVDPKPFLISECKGLKGRPQVVYLQDHRHGEPRSGRWGSWRVFWSHQEHPGGSFELKSRRIQNRFESFFPLRLAGSPDLLSIQYHGPITGSTYFHVGSNGCHALAALLVPHPSSHQRPRLQTILFDQAWIRDRHETKLAGNHFTGPIRVAAGNCKQTCPKTGGVKPNRPNCRTQSRFLVALREAVVEPSGKSTRIKGYLVQTLVEPLILGAIEVGPPTPLNTLPANRFPDYDLSFDSDRGEYRLTANSNRIRGHHIESLRIDENGYPVSENKEWRGALPVRPPSHRMDLLVTGARRITGLATATPAGEKNGILLFRQDQRLTLQAFRRGAPLAGRSPQNPTAVRLMTTDPYIPFDRPLIILAAIPTQHAGPSGIPSEQALQVRVQDADGVLRIYESALDRIDSRHAQIHFTAGQRRGLSLWDWRVVDSRGRTAPAATGEWAEGGSFEVVRALRGDVNRDGRINVTDAFNILNYLYMGTIHPRFDRTAADVNADGRVTLTDCIYLLNWLFRGGPAALPMP